VTVTVIVCVKISNLYDFVNYKWNLFKKYFNCLDVTIR
jgi:hypothetical protein